MEHGSNAQNDLIELWRRIVFNIMISNVDDHLRNHGFLYDHLSSGWQLSPIYDLEPAPEHIKARFLRTNIDFHNNAASLDLAYEVAEEFGLKNHQAKTIVKEVADAVKQWAKEAERFGANNQEIEFMSSAFEHDNLKLGENKTRSIVSGWVNNFAAPPYSSDIKVLEAIAAGQGDVGIVNTYYYARQ